MKRGFTISILASASFLCSSLSASDSNPKQPADISSKCAECIPTVSTNSGTTSIDWFADILYWRAKQCGTENWGQILDVNVPKGRIDILEVDFKWDPGFRVGVGYRMDHDCWDTQFMYTRFKTQGTDHVTSDDLITSSFLGNFYFENLAGFAFSGPQYHKASIKWTIDFNVFDGELGRKFWISKALSLRPFMGVKGGWIYQRIRSKWKDPNTTSFERATENLKNDFRGIGPSAGLNTLWKLWRCEHSSFSLFGDVSGAIMWGKWTLKDVYRNDAPYKFPVVQADIKGAASMLRLFVGFQWESSLNKNRSTLSARLGFESQFWLEQLQFYSFNMGRLDNQLSLQGGTAEVRFDF